eukprot:CAMPEP_0182873828 /NCGR_PEP_ID=MMETSP0034_2-20130328/12566_1 /TAXON_ID=156128 /ORGANISM="Nephroselmis pyriformis, Strain CCMP717" /LENGTH=71 /DNA_ID=CAMNT_0025006503 /DNA_START=83 /DNA_END=294 /DNA_ORIENTATION=+
MAREQEEGVAAPGANAGQDPAETSAEVSAAAGAPSSFSRFTASMWGLADSLGLRRVQEYFTHVSTGFPKSR